jgi:TATA-box binding protein (TBP) (component of TFIID and TFIIIB)
MFLIRNIKVSVKVNAVILNNALGNLKSNNIITKEFCNFITFKSNSFTYILFKTGKAKDTHINITQIKDFSLINVAINCLINLIKCTVISYSVDNIIATSDLLKPVCLTEIIKRKKFQKVKYNNEVFPGLFIKFNKGTIIVFHSGKIVIVGCKSVKDIECLMNFLHVNI